MKETKSCPICKGTGKITTIKAENYTLENRKRAKKLHKEGYSYREIMTMMGYKSPRSISKLMNDEK